MTRKSKTARRNRQRVLGGKGGYFDKSKNGETSNIGKALRYLGGLAGGAVAPYAGAPPTSGVVAGRTLAAHISKWLGYGSYKVSRNSIMEASNATIPMMHNAKQSVVVRHKEYLGDVVSSIAYAKQLELPLNPGLPGSFPWLATLARQYQEYTWRGMVFHFIPTVGEAVSSTVPAFGNVMMHTEYRVTAPAPATKSELLNEYFASDARPCETFIHPIECDPKENPYNVQYVRTGAVPGGEDPKTYDLGMFRAFTQGQAADNIVMGEIWVTYEVELRKPQLTSYAGDATNIGFLAPTSSLPLGATRITIVDALGIRATATTVEFPKRLFGKFKVDIYWSSAGSLTTGSLSLGYNSALVPSPFFGAAGSANSQQHGLQSGSTTSGFYSFVVTTDGTNVGILTYGATIMTGCDQGNIIVTRLP